MATTAQQLAHVYAVEGPALEPGAEARHRAAPEGADPAALVTAT